MECQRCEVASILVLYRPRFMKKKNEMKIDPIFVTNLNRSPTFTLSFQFQTVTLALSKAFSFVRSAADASSPCLNSVESGRENAFPF